MPATQKFDDKNMRLRFKSPVDGLVLTSVSGSEEISRLFAFELYLRCKDPFEFKDLVGKQVTIELDSESTEITRYFNGFITDLRETGYVLQADGSYSHTKYQATMRPWLWFLTQTTDCRVFQKGIDDIKNIPDIVKKVFRDNGMSSFEDRLQGNYRDWIYCVQYRESDFAFVSRLMENEGIYFFFEHKDGEHTLVMADDVDALKAFDSYDTIEFNAGHRSIRTEHLSQWAHAQSVQPFKYAQRDYDFEKPKVKLESKNENTKEHDQGIPEPEVYDWTGEYIEQSDGDEYVKRRLQELQCHHERVLTSGPCYGLSPGCVVKLEKHEHVNEGDKFLVVAVQHSIQNEGFGSSGTTGKESYHVSGELQPISTSKSPSTQQFRPARITPRPLIQGVQSALVVGPSSEEIYCDKYGRVKVQFHWDRYGSKDENSSCWIRVSQFWGGKDWGSVHIPRIGQEVLVSFLEGDPDQPVITGRVYNADQTTPYALEANKTQSGWKSRSSPGGGPDNFNEIRMEDKKGSEELYIQAEKNETILVKNDKQETVGNNETINIGNDRTETVGHNETITVQNTRTDTVMMDEIRSVMNNRTRTVAKNETVTVTLTRTHTVGVNEAITVGGAQEITVGGMQETTVGGMQGTTVGASREVSVLGGQSVDVGRGFSLQVGKDFATDVGKNATTDVGEKLNIKAGDEIALKCGKAEIIMKKNGDITLKGKNIVVKASGKITGKASSTVSLKGSSVKDN